MKINLIPCGYTSLVTTQTLGLAAFRETVRRSERGVEE
jgi:hypothetical protein